MPPPPTPTSKAPMKGERLVILHSNDFHGKLNAEKAAAIRKLKDSTGALYFDSGDCIKTGNLGFPIGLESAWQHLAAAGCDASVLGNRETHVLAAAFRAKVAGAEHPILCANLRDRAGGRPLPASLILQHGQLKVGVIGVMVPMVTGAMPTQAASAFLWDQPILVLKEVAKKLREEVDLLVALTHIGHKQDVKAAEACPEVDLILGGHSHTVLATPERWGNTWICQGGSHGRFLGRYEFEVGAGLVGAELIPLP